MRRVLVPLLAIGLVPLLAIGFALSIMVASAPATTASAVAMPATWMHAKV